MKIKSWVFRACVQTCTFMHTRCHWGLSACEWSFCNASKSPSSKLALFCGNPKAPVRLLTPKWHAAPVPSRDLVSIDFDDFPFQGRLGKDPKQPRSNGAFMLYSGIKSVRCRNGPVRVISVYTRTPDPPISITPHPPLASMVLSYVTCTPISADFF